VSPDALTVEIRARTRWEAVDLGLALVQAHWRKLYAVWFTLVLPVFFLALVSAYLSYDGKIKFYGIFLLWWLKPLYDRALLHVLSRAVFGETVNWRKALRAMPGLLRHSGLFRALTWGRVLPRRSFKLPIWQLEGVSGQARSQRLSTLKGDGATRLAFVCSALETALFIGVLRLLHMLQPAMQPTDLDHLNFIPFSDFFTGNIVPVWFEAACTFFYLLVISVIEPFYVAAGFTLYLNRRTELEGWDIELGFRTLASRLEAQQARSSGSQAGMAARPDARQAPP
jgi:hypothetical protein